MDTLEQTLDDLLDGIEARARQVHRNDAIDDILGAEPRDTTVQSLRDHEVVRQFRAELSDGLIRVDTAHRLLGLIHTVVTAILAS